MRILILGGTVFLGRYLVEAALARGHEITLFNRGKHNPDLFPQVEKLRGDRDGGLGSLEGRRWDVVADMCGYLPRVVAQSARLLAGAVDRYLFVSSVSVYADFSSLGIEENYPLASLADPAVEEVTGETYGGLKALCERSVENAFPGRALLVRPGLIVGPHDPTNRFTYWPWRVARGGPVLAPHGPGLPVQVIDVRDLADWSVRMLEAKSTGTYNVTGPASMLTLGQLLDECRRVSGSDATFTWVPESFLLAEGVSPWTELPLWVPQTPDMIGFSDVDIQKALGTGLTFRPLSETIRDALDWDARRQSDWSSAAALQPEREAELLERWRKHSSSPKHP